MKGRPAASGTEAELPKKFRNRAWWTQRKNGNLRLQSSTHQYFGAQNALTKNSISCPTGKVSLTSCLLNSTRIVPLKKPSSPCGETNSTPSELTHDGKQPLTRPLNLRRPKEVLNHAWAIIKAPAMSPQCTTPTPVANVCPEKTSLPKLLDEVRQNCYLGFKKSGTAVETAISTLTPSTPPRLPAREQDCIYYSKNRQNETSLFSQQSTR